MISGPISLGPSLVHVLKSFSRMLLLFLLQSSLASFSVSNQFIEQNAADAMERLVDHKPTRVYAELCTVT